MKKGLLILLAIFLLPTFLAVEITLSKDSYQPQELFQTEITGNFVSLTENNIFIFQGEKAHPDPVIKGLTKQNNIYYFYAILPNTPGNFTLRIQDTEYIDRGIIKSDPIIKELTIILKNTSDLSINPGFIIPNKDFSIKVKSLIGNPELTATFEATGETKQLTLFEQNEETLKFSLPELPPQQSKLIVNDYKIPVFLIQKTSASEMNLEFIPYRLDGTLAIDDYNFDIIVKNTGFSNLTDIILSSNLDSTIEPETIALLEPSQTAAIKLTISITDLNHLSGQVTAEANNIQFPLPIQFNITENETEVEILERVLPSNDTQDGIFSCAQLGNLCDINQICSGDTVESLDGPCCIGSCNKVQESNTSFYIGIILAIILILIVIYIIWKIRKKKKLKSPEDLLKEKSDRYKERIRGKPDKGEQVEGKLDKV